MLSLDDVFRGLSNDRRQMAWTSASDCSRSRSLGLVRSQRRLCQNHLDLMPSVIRAARDTVDICQDLFADRRWNCSTILLAPNFLPDLAGSKLTLWRPLLPGNPYGNNCHMGTAIEHPVPNRVKPSLVIFDIRALWRWGLSRTLIKRRSYRRNFPASHLACVWQCIM